LEAERAECEWLLTSGVLGRSGNLARILRYVCEEYFQGRADQIKEYTIAVEALGRRPEFDPKTDTIVRVTVHALRKRLMEVYQHEGADRAVRLILPPGHYVPSFVHRHGADQRQISRLPEGNSGSVPSQAAGDESNLPRRDFWNAVRNWAMPLLLALSVAAVVAAVWWAGHTSKRTRPVEVEIISAGLPLPAPQATIHALLGRRRPTYVDHSGETWTNGNYCSSGTSVSLPSQRIEGTEDAPLYLGGVRGMVHCAFPVPQGMYEMHFHFAEASDLPVATHNTSLSINAGPAQYMDVVDVAGGDNIATSIIVTGVKRENDGSIHLDYVSEVSLLNAVEILPTPSAQQLPIRIVANSSSFIDDAKQLWASDRYFSGGRYSQHPRVDSAAGVGVYRSARIGRFRYNIPAVPGAYYRVRLYFRDPWFREDNGGFGGPGSRVFDVACNGVLLMKNFDILAEGDSKPVVKTFEHVQASTDGRIELYFMPVVNFAAVSAIEILPED
jgi:Malectin domain